jgi:hypothetical protein
MAKKKTPPAPPPQATPLLSTRTWAIAGVALVGGIVAWKLAGSSYRSDVELVCNAEKASGFRIDRELSKVSEWVKSHLATPEGNEFFSSLGDLRVSERAVRLEQEAGNLHLKPCPLVDSYRRVAADGEYRSDLQHLCSNVAFPRLVELGDDDRLARLEDWIGGQPKSPRTRDLAEPLRQAKTGAERAKVLREAAGKMDVYSCDVAKTLEAPQALPPPAAGGVRVASTPQINGQLKEEDVARAVVEVTPALDDCYRKAAAGAAVSGKLAVKLEVDPDGKVAKASPVDVTVDDREAVACILQGLRTMKLPRNPGPIATVLVPLELSGNDHADRTTNHERDGGGP